MPTLRESSAAYRTYHSARPADPVWATACVAEARKALSNYDRDLDLWWSETSECWRVMQFYYSINQWVEQLRWIGPGGEYRPLDSPSALVNAMDRIRVPHDEANRACDTHNEELEEKKWEDSVDLQVTVANERVVKAPAMVAHNRTPRGKSPLTWIQIDPEYIKLARKRGNTRYGYEQ